MGYKGTILGPKLNLFCHFMMPGFAEYGSDIISDHLQ